MDLDRSIRERAQPQRRYPCRRSNGRGASVTHERRTRKRETPNEHAVGESESLNASRYHRKGLAGRRTELFVLSVQPRLVVRLVFYLQRLLRHLQRPEAV